jgi:hypothetical protein
MRRPLTHFLNLAALPPHHCHGQNQRRSHRPSLTHNVRRLHPPPTICSKHDSSSQLRFRNKTLSSVLGGNSVNLSTPTTHLPYRPSLPSLLRPTPHTYMHELQTWSVARQTRLELPTELHSSRHNNVCLPPRILSLRDLLRCQLTSPLARRLLPPSTPAQLPSHLPTSRPHLRVSLRSRSRSTLMLVRLPLTRLLTGLSPML